MDVYYAKPGPITPVALIGEKIVVYRTKRWYLCSVLYREGLPFSSPLVANLGVVAAAAQVNGVSLQPQIEMDDNEIGQFRMVALDDAEFQLWQPRANGRFKTKNVLARIGLASRVIDADDHLTEFFVFENEWPFVDAINNTGYALPLTRLGFYGFRYGIEKVKETGYDHLRDVPAPYAAIVGEGA